MRTMWMGAACAALWLCSGVAHGQGKNSPNCGADLSATVWVEGSQALVDDGGGAYGGSSKENVRLQINNCTFDLVMNFSTSRRRVLAYIRNDGTTTVPLTLLNFDRLASVPVGLTWDDATQKYYQRDGVGNLVESPFCNGPLASIPPPASQTPPQDNYAGCGVDELGKVYVRRTLTAQIEGREDRRLVMQTSPLDGHSKPLRDYCGLNSGAEACLTSYVRVYRTGPKTWILSPEPGPRLNDTEPQAIENLHTSTGFQPGMTRLVLPFRITVTVP